MFNNIGTILYFFFFTNFKAQDEFGNKYYQAKCKNSDGRYKRYVMYNGIIEASKVPPMWNAWLRYKTDILPRNNMKYKWQQRHKPNLTGTDYAYLPPGHPLSGMKGRDKSVGDYQAWKP